MRHVFLALFNLFVLSSVITGQMKYAVTEIPDSLKSDADAVIRFYSTSYNRKSPGKYTMIVQFAVTVMNRHGRDMSELVIHYDRNSKVGKIKGTLYNAQGMELGELKKNDLGDYAVNASYTLFSDNRVKHFRPPVSAYPFTVEYQYIVENTETIGFPAWLPQKDFDVSVEKAELLFVTVPDNDIRFKTMNYNFDEEIKEDDGQKTYKWMVNGLPAVGYEPKAPGVLDLLPVLMLAPDQIEYEGTQGDFTTWGSYGKWVNGLISSRDELPEATVSHIREITGSLHSKREKAKAVYRYMQGRTRYVNIALGIGGFQPLPAATVDEKGYGDCKALSNYTKALLKAAGIESFYAEIGTGSYHEIRSEGFSSTNQTNHVMLCVPLETDSVWLECTNQSIPFGYIGLSSQGRNALLVKPEGGHLARTPLFEDRENTRISSVTCTIGEPGTSAFSATTTWHNNFYDEISGFFDLSPREQKEELLKTFSGKNSLTIGEFYVKDNSDTCFTGELFFQGNISNYPLKAGSRIIFEPLFFHSGGLPKLISVKRKLPVEEPLKYTCVDTFNVNLPQNFELEYLAENLEFSNSYGSYSLEGYVSGNSLTVLRKLTVNKGLYARAQFAQINEFLKAVAEGNSKKIILKTKT